MKHFGRAIATVATMAGCVTLGYFVNDSCTIAACMIICMLFIWGAAD